MEIHLLEMVVLFLPIDPVIWTVYLIIGIMNLKEIKQIMMEEELSGKGLNLQI